MIQAPDLPGWAALLVALFVLSGAMTALIGSIGLLRFKSFYERVHAPTLGSTLGVVLIVSGSIVSFSVLRSRPSVHEILILLFLTSTTPVGLMLLARTSLYRDRVEGLNVPGRDDDATSDRVPGDPLAQSRAVPPDAASTKP